MTGDERRDETDWLIAAPLVASFAGAAAYIGGPLGAGLVAGMMVAAPWIQSVIER